MKQILGQEVWQERNFGQSRDRYFFLLLRRQNEATEIHANWAILAANLFNWCTGGDSESWREQLMSKKPSFPLSKFLNIPFSAWIIFFLVCCCGQRLADFLVLAPAPRCCAFLN
jgi:hypothetical protein